MTIEKKLNNQKALECQNKVGSPDVKGNNDENIHGNSDDIISKTSFDCIENKLAKQDAMRDINHETN